MLSIISRKRKGKAKGREAFAIIARAHRPREREMRERERENERGIPIVKLLDDERTHHFWFLVLGRCAPIIDLWDSCMRLLRRLKEHRLLATWRGDDKDYSAADRRLVFLFVRATPASDVALPVACFAGQRYLPEAAFFFSSICVNASANRLRTEDVLRGSVVWWWDHEIWNVYFGACTCLRSSVYCNYFFLSYLFKRIVIF